MIHCAIASRARDVPEAIRQSILTSLHNLLLGPEMAKVASTRCLGSVQVLLLLSMCDELHAADAVQARENAWQNVGTAIRMAFAIVSLFNQGSQADYRRYIDMFLEAKFSTISLIGVCGCGEQPSSWIDGMFRR